ncbi:hypothetical protein KAJ89_00310 [Candidatus Parcubacteria bacterium]|nr:hypothetical protein [Candidatus Parcubacteria bacterium]
MNIYLKDNWSEQFIYGDETPGFFVGRDQERKNLKSVINNNDSSAILISSVRGVGKTSFVHKVLSEIGNDKITPFFVNIGHTLAIEDIEKEKQKILVSIIRHAYWENPKDKEIKELYFDCIGRSVESHEDSYEKKSTKEKSTTLEFKPKIETLIAIIGGFFVGIALLNSWPDWIKLIICSLGFSGIVFSSKWESVTKKIHKANTMNTVDDATDYIEIKFEKWLENKTKKDGKKLIFVVDELDKIETIEAFKHIKEYKNLFARSRGHFLFLSNFDAYDLTQKNRELSVEEGGIFPTFFTHIFYLPLPKTSELKQYLKEIFIENAELDKKEINELSNYLLLRSGNDFFELKKLIADVVSYDDNEKTCIETKKLIKEDAFYSKISELFEYVNTFFLDRKLKELKKSWKDNSILQKDIFEFLNVEFNKNFDSVKYDKENIINLIKFLNSIGIIEKKDKTEIDNTDYIWTGKYKRNVGALLEETDKEFNSSFRKLIKIANDLDDLPDNYKTNKFEKQDAVFEDLDGQDLSDISLYSTFNDYKGLFKALKYSANRITITHEKVKEAKKTVDEQIKNVSQKYYSIFINILTKIFEDNNEIFKNEPIDSANHNINGVFSTLPEILSTITAYKSAVFGKTDQSKYVLIVKYFEDEENIQNSLAVLRNNKNILVINLLDSDKHEISTPKIFQDAAGRKRKKAMVVDNFINFKFNDFRQFVKILTKIEDHLTN